MPTPEYMTWVPARRRWTRMHRGKRFWVSCKALGVPETKEESVHAANAWWIAKQAELDAAGKPVPRQPLPLEDVAGAERGSADGLANLKRLLLDALAKDDSPARPTERGDDEIEMDAPDVERERRSEVMGLLERLFFGDAATLPPAVSEHLPPARVNQIQDGVRAIRGEVAARSERSVRALADAWISLQVSMVDAGQVTAARVNNVRMALAHFAAWLGGDSPAEGIDAAKLQGFYQHCLAQVSARRKDGNAGWSLPFAKEVFAVARTWLRWLTEQGTIDPPRNLAARFRFGSTVKKIPTWTIPEVQRVIGEAPGKLKLALLLMCNCGMTQQDVSDLRDEEVDWQRGTITRKRSKTAHVADVPTVTYCLWPLTWKLLQQYRSGSELVLLTESGLPYVRSEMIDGKLRKADGFTSNYAHLKRRLKFSKPMKWLRKTASTLLDTYEPSGRLSTLFLGHAPSTMKDRHYAAPPQALFDEAVHWLGVQLGLAD